MEKSISQEDRIRRAEEIYNRRSRGYREINKYESIYEKPKESIKVRLTRKIIFQMIVSIFIYTIIYALNETNFGSSNVIKTKINEFLMEDIPVQEIYNNVANNIKQFIGKLEENNNDFINNEINNNIESIENNTILENNIISEENITTDVKDEISAVGGAVSENIEETKDQSQLDCEFVKDNYNIIWPLKGVITSRYGTREATEIVTANHYGIDIAGNTGTTIIAAIDGIVSVSSAEGDYGKHIQIDNGNVSTLYAHCSYLCVEKGAMVKQGDKIAEVGQTGRATGPHLHFEIKLDGRTINPENILETM